MLSIDEPFAPVEASRFHIDLGASGSSSIRLILDAPEGGATVICRDGTSGRQFARFHLGGLNGQSVRLRAPTDCGSFLMSTRRGSALILRSARRGQRIHGEYHGAIYELSPAIQTAALDAASYEFDICESPVDFEPAHESVKLRTRSVLFGEGWYRPERHNREKFRWLGSSGGLFLVPPRTAEVGLLIDLRAGPLLGLPDAELRLSDAPGKQIAATAIPPHGRLWLPLQSPEPGEYRLDVHNPNARRYDKDARTLNLRVNRIKLTTRDEFVASSSRRPEGSSVALVAEDANGVLLETPTAELATPVHLGTRSAAAANSEDPASWREHSSGHVLVRAPSAQEFSGDALMGVMLDIEAGARLNLATASVSLVGSRGVVASSHVPPRGTLFLPLDPTDEDRSVRISVENPDPHSVEVGTEWFEARLWDARCMSYDDYRSEVAADDPAPELTGSRVGIGPGWYHPDYGATGPFRWSAGTAEISIDDVRSGFLELELAGGPACLTQELTVTVDGELVAKLPLDREPSLHHVALGGAPAAGPRWVSLAAPAARPDMSDSDPRILAFRLMGAEWRRSRRRLSFRR